MDNITDLHGEDTEWTRDMWCAEVAAKDTQLGYWDWVQHQQEANNE